MKDPNFRNRVIIHMGIHVLFNVVSRVHATGLEHIQGDAPMILAANHLTRLDPPLMYYFRPRGSPLVPMVAEKWRSNFFFRWVMESMDAVWLNREEVDRDALRGIVGALKQGRSIGIAPEGTRSKNHQLQWAKPGVAWLARTANVPVAPVAMWGIEKVKPNFQKLKRTDIYLSVGEPMQVTREDDLEEATHRIMKNIACMLPEQYRGVYA